MCEVLVHSFDEARGAVEFVTREGRADPISADVYNLLT